ncbi:MAG: OsmC family protein [Myxococcaceae bacterium]|nr:OsmC family protein [Myxococcaceae bacterium]MCI0673137.1 OsmC family protein [Myxococcaceae bacterium]
MNELPRGVMMQGVSAPGLKVRMTHGPSGTEVTTDAPKDNGGTGLSFSPTDMVGAALASCALTTMALVASREGFTFGEASATVEKRMTPPPRRIGALLTEIRMPRGLTPEQRARMEEAALGCPVKRSLDPSVEAPIRFVYAD